MTAMPLGRYVAVPHRDDRLPRGRRVAGTAAALVAILVGVCVASLLLGQYSLSPIEILESFARRLGLAPATDASMLADGAMWNVRIPRIITGVLVGAALGTAGAITQGVFGNPLAEPGVIGITAGASVGASFAFVLVGGAVISFAVPAAAFVGGILTTLIVWALASSVRGGTTLVLVLVGIAVNAVAGAASSLLIFLAESTSREAIVFWQLGSLNGSTWSTVLVCGVLVGVGVVLACTLGPGLDSLALGERAASHTGLNLRLFRVSAVLIAALLTAAAVAAAGMIGFVGLIVPHVLRLIVGPRSSVILPLSALGGAALIAMSDVAARNLVPFTDLPIGVFTACVGGPVFFLLLRTRLQTTGAA